MNPTLQSIPIANIKTAPGNPRRNVGDVAELAASIKTHGILEPLLAIDGNGEGVLLVAGQRRLAAAKKAGLTEVPVIMRTLDEAQRLEVQLIENLQREDLDPLDEALAFKQLLDLGCTESKLAERIGRSQSHISKRLSLLKLPAPVQAGLSAGALQLADAYELTKLADKPELVKKAIAVRKQNGYMRDMKQAVDQVTEEQKELDRRAGARAKLQSAGIKILREENYAQFYGKPEKPLAGQGEHDCINLTPQQHAGKSCHAAIIVRGGEIIYVCKNPSNHPGAKTSSRVPGLSPAEKGQRAKRLEGQKIMKAAREERAKTMKAMLKSVKKGVSAEHILLQLVAIAGSEEARIAEELLEIPQPKSGSVYSPDVVEKYATKGEKELWRAALALALGAGESNLRSGFNYGRAKGRVARHLALLTKAGYRPVAAERKLAK